MIKIEKDKTNLDKCLKDIEQIGQRIDKKEKEVAALKEKKKELSNIIIQSVLKDNNITISELVGTINELYAVGSDSNNNEEISLSENMKQTENTETEEING